MFVGLHMMLAAQTNTPELAITEDEGKAFTRSAQNVLRHYSVETTQKTLDWIAFIGTCGGIYGTRFAAINMRKRQEKAERRQAAPSNVAHFPGPIMPDYGDGVAGE